jgi:hypothetical protein
MIAPDRATVGVERVTALSAVGSGVPVAGMDQGLPIVVGGFFTRTGPNFLQPHWVWWQPGEVLLDWLPPEGAAEVTDFFSWPGPPVFAKTWLPLKINAAEIATSDTAFDIVVIAVSLICSRSLTLYHNAVRAHVGAFARRGGFAGPAAGPQGMAVLVVGVIFADIFSIIDDAVLTVLGSNCGAGASQECNRDGKGRQSFADHVHIPLRTAKRV